MRAYSHCPRKEVLFFTEYLCHVCRKIVGEKSLLGSSKQLRDELVARANVLSMARFNRPRPGRPQNVQRLKNPHEIWFGISLADDAAAADEIIVLLGEVSVGAR
jgi:hypothetical protein